MRRQNISCDQCRKAKRACDAAPLVPDRSSSLSGGREPQTTKPCSYCYKTKKHCTRYWAGSRSQINSSSARKGYQSTRRRDVDPRTTKHPNTTGPPSIDLFDITQVPADNHQDLFWWSPACLGLGNVVPGGDDQAGAMLLTEGFYDVTQSDTTWDGLALGDSPIQQTEASPGSHAALLEVYNENNLEEAVTAISHYAVSDCSSTYQDVNHPSVVGLGQQEEASWTAFPTTNRRQPSSDWSRISRASLSPFSTQHTMTSRTHNNYISQNLMQVYHDVLEHTLSCWVCEESCPYKMLRQNRIPFSSPISISQGPSSLLENTSARQEWGDVWSNRIYARVITLDRAAQSAGIIQLTHSENQAASKAFHLSIMAFSAQWAQKSRREQRQYSAIGSPELNLDEEMTEEFDRQIQRSLWWQARRALDHCAELECYRVVCAELIFGLTQKPWDSVGFASRHDGGPISNSQPRSMKDVPIATQVQALLSRDGPPIFIERAVRKVHTLKFVMDARTAGLSQSSRTRLDQSNPEAPTAINNQDRQTIGFLYWLAVISDTVSATMNQRPIVVADRDCQHDATNDSTSVEKGSDGQSTILPSERRWVIHHFMQDDPRSPAQPLRWPCSYDTAARAVTRSGPVKVLFYRHVSYLQDAIQRGYHGEVIEEIIRNAVLVYRYWNTTYGVFFRDLIHNYSTVPPRIQSWFSCILAHWHLATLLLADLLECVDEGGLGDCRAGQLRAASETVENIRRASADELADIARIVTPPDWTQGAASPPPPQLPGFHSAVNRAVILTDPWTVVLVRAFSKACVWHFGKAQQENQNRDVLSYFNQDVQRSISQCTDCVKALWQLGKKSDMAWSIAETLASALADLRQ